MDKKADDETRRRLDLERQEINDAYDRGFSQDMNDLSTNTKVNNSSKNTSKLNTSDKAFNNNNELIDRTDRYGFIHEHKLPPTLTENELKRNKIEKIREKKWIEMLKNWHSFSNVNTKHNQKLVSRIYKGVPDSMRNQAWHKLLEIENQIKAQTGVYEKMKTFARQYSNELRQIDLDINRTFRNNLAYKNRYCQRQQQLYNILAAYSIYNTEIGYCQGMSTVTALLLMYLSDEEKTFWALSQLMSNNRYSMHGFFKRGFPKLIRYTDKHEMIIKTLLPKVHKKFLNCNITSLLYTTKWFLQCFLDALPFSLVLRVWDVYLLKGDIVLLAMSYCILKMHKRRLLQREFDMDKINEFLNHRLAEDFLYSDDKVMNKLEVCIEKLSKFKFPTGYLMAEPIPKNELPSQPFGDFRKIDKTDIINQIAQKSSEQSLKDRDAFVVQLAKDRLAVELKKREERRSKRREERIARGEAVNDNEDDDDEDYNFEHEDNDDDEEDDDDDEDRVEKESLMSNLTRPPTPQRSFSEFLSRSRISLTNPPFKSEQTTPKKSDSSPRPHNLPPNPRLSSDYENSQSSSSKLNQSPIGSSKQVSSIYDSKPSPVKSPMLPSRQNKYDINNNTSTIAQQMQPLVVQTMGSPARKPVASISPVKIVNSSNTASIMSNPPPISPSSYLSSTTPPPTQAPASAGIQKSNITTIISHPAYYQPNAFNSTNLNYDYIRSPHGIYTRVNKTPITDTTNLNGYIKSPSLKLNNNQYTHAYAHLPQSSSSFMISSAAAAAAAAAAAQQHQQHSNSSSYNNNTSSLGSNYYNNNTNFNNNSAHLTNNLTIPSNSNNINKQRTSSLRNVNNRPNLNLVNSPTTTTTATAANTNFNARVNTPTKQQLQNHSIRIASIQQHQQQQMSVHNHYPTISIISQAPKASNQAHSHHVSSAYQAPPVSYHRSASSHSSTFNSKRYNTNDDLIEQYDYI